MFPKYVTYSCPWSEIIILTCLVHNLYSLYTDIFNRSTHGLVWCGMNHCRKANHKKDGLSLVSPLPYHSGRSFSKLFHSGSKNADMRFRTTLLHTIKRIGACVVPCSMNLAERFHADNVAHVVIPRHPTLRPHDRVLHHFRFIQALLPRDVDGLTPLHYYDSAIQLARHASREPTEPEFEIGMKAAGDIIRVYGYQKFTLQYLILTLPD